MGLADIAYSILPKSSFKALSKLYYKYKKSLFKPLSVEEFAKILVELGIRKGDVVFIHSSLDKLHLNFPVKDVLHLLEQTVGEEGTLLFPSWSYAGRTEDYIKNPDTLFDVKKSPTYLGLLPELARRKRAAHRSLHPTASVAAIGKYAEELTSEHEQSIYACDEKSPFYKMMSHKAKIIGLGEKTMSLSFLHCVEDVMGKEFPVELYYPHTAAVRVKNSEGIERVMNVFVHKNEHFNNIPKFIKRNVPKNVCRDLKLKGVNYFNADASQLFEHLTRLAKEGKTIYS